MTARFRDAKLLPVRQARCKTCPFRDFAEGGWEQVRPLLIQRALSEATPICHSTGPAALVHHNGEKLPEHLCRGARCMQLRLFHSIRYIAAATDEAWDAKRRELGL